MIRHLEQQQKLCAKPYRPNFFLTTFRTCFYQMMPCYHFACRRTKYDRRLYRTWISAYFLVFLFGFADCCLIVPRNNIEACVYGTIRTARKNYPKQ